MEETETTQVEIPSPTEVTQEQTTEDAAAPEPSAEEEAPPAPPWASAKDEYELEEHPALQTFFQRRDQRMEERLRGEFQTHLEDATKQWESTELHKTLSGHVGNIAEKLRDAEALDEKTAVAIDRTLERLEKLTEPYKEEYRKLEQGKGSREMATHLTQTMLNTLGRREQDELHDYLRTASDWGKVLEKYAEFKAKAAENKAYDRGLKEGREAALEDARAKSRDGLGPDTTERRPTGGRPTPQEYQAATAEQRKKWRDEGIEPAV